MIDPVEQFWRGNLTYLIGDMKDQGIPVDYLLRVARLIRKYERQN